MAQKAQHKLDPECFADSYRKSPKKTFFIFAVLP